MIKMDMLVYGLTDIFESLDKLFTNTDTPGMASEVGDIDDEE